MFDTTREIKKVCSNLSHLVKELEKYSFPLVAQKLASLLLQQEYHQTNTRIEVLIHLAAIYCRGNRNPTECYVGRWSNDKVLKVVVAELDNSVTDVFVSNVVAWFGNARLFEGLRSNNADHVQVCVSSLNTLRERRWVPETVSCICVLLKLSEAVAERMKIQRYCQSHGMAEEITSLSKSAGECLVFGFNDLIAYGINPQHLDPFVIQQTHANALVEQSFGCTELERRPLVRFEGKTIVVLPTAIGLAVMRFAIERALSANELSKFQSAWHQEQFNVISRAVHSTWGMKYVQVIRHNRDDELEELVGLFDEGAYLHLIFVPDKFEHSIHEGVSNIQILNSTIQARIREQFMRFNVRSDYRRGLTLLVHGGICGQCDVTVEKLPSTWHFTSLSAPDFILLGAKHDLTALRTWKLLEYVEELADAGVVIQNPSGFINLMAFAYHVNFELVPPNTQLQPMHLGNVFLAPLRYGVRASLDKHGVVAPDGESYIWVQNRATEDQFKKEESLSVLYSVDHMLNREVLTCVETINRPWWVYCQDLPEESLARDFVFKIIDMTCFWLVRLAPLLEKRAYHLPSGPVTYELQFADLHTIVPSDFQIRTKPSAPSFRVKEGKVCIDCTLNFVRSFNASDNSGDPLMVQVLTKGCYELSDQPMPSDTELDDVVRTIVTSQDARHFRWTPAKTPADRIYDGTAIPKLRVTMREDQAWSRFNLGRSAGYDFQTEHISSKLAVTIIEKAVQCIWERRIRPRLMQLSRKSVIERFLLNFEAAQKEHRDWFGTSAAQVALHDPAKVMHFTRERLAQRETVGVSSRALVEMALSTSPCDNGVFCTDVDFDFLLAETSTLLYYATYKDALNFGLVDGQLKVNANGSLDVHTTHTQVIRPLFDESCKRLFDDAVASHPLADEDSASILAINFERAFEAEFGLSIRQYQKLEHDLTIEALKRNASYYWLKRSEVISHLKTVGVAEPEFAFSAFVLEPRQRWDEKKPVNAKKRDWYPWRFNRRLSVLRRPLVQLTTEDDPSVLVMPSIIVGTLSYLLQASDGRLSSKLFDSSEMCSYIGKATNKNGHEFNRKVAKRFEDFGWQSISEVPLNRLGGDEELGDIDVLTWNRETGLVIALECKNLKADRTYGEIGRRLREYSKGTHKGKRTDLQKHLDRASFLRANKHYLTDVTGIPTDRAQLLFGLVTESLAPMQFIGDSLTQLDLVADYDQLEEVIRLQVNK